jgi:hypothetical protein
MTASTLARRSVTQLVAGLAIMGLAAFLGTACSTRPDDSADEGQDEGAIAETLEDDNAPLLVKDPRTLTELEQRGLSLATVIGAEGGSGRELMATPAYKRISDVITRDLQILRIQDNRSGVGFDFGHRQFDPRWLGSPQSRFELVGVVNRLDRKHVAGCGEFRFIYRLAYSASRSASRLPMTVNVVFPQADDGQGCATVAQRWLDAKSGTADALLDGPLKDRAPYASIEINVQAVRWPSNERPEFGGHAEYILRVFHAGKDGLEIAPLENTPRIDLSDAEREELRLWIRDNVQGIDQGTALVPAKFLAKQAISVGPRGLSRLANKAFGQLFADPNAAFGDLPFGETKQIGSVAGLMRRLDTMTCHGCHQARAIAGFHLLGEERDNGARLNALAIGRSPHFKEELPWRTDMLNSVAEGGTFAAPRPFAEHGADAGKYGSHCGLGESGFSSWTCAADLECLAFQGDGTVGICSAKSAPVGDACQIGKTTPNKDSHRDHVVDVQNLACDQDGRNARCIGVEQGFPDGMCRADCTEAEYGTIKGESICGPVPSASGLTRCLTVDRLPFKECLARENTATFLRTCDRTEECRDDYACTRVQGGPAGVGACMPPYFAFQARVDGHLFDPL